MSVSTKSKVYSYYFDSILGGRHIANIHGYPELQVDTVTETALRQTRV